MKNYQSNTGSNPNNDSSSNDDQTSPAKERLRSILSTLAIVILAPLIAFSLTAFVFQSYEVDGPSMETTLQHQDRLIVYKLPRTIARISGNDYLPHRGDIIIFNTYEIGNEKKQLIKRVIGLPGERVTIKDGTVTVFNKQNPAGFEPDSTMSYGKVIVTTPNEKEIDVTIPEKTVFVLGDNRANSLDSRGLGPVPAKDIVGKLSMRLFPLSQAKKF